MFLLFEHLYLLSQYILFTQISAHYLLFQHIHINLFNSFSKFVCCFSTYICCLDIFYDTNQYIFLFVSAHSSAVSTHFMHTILSTFFCCFSTFSAVNKTFCHSSAATIHFMHTLLSTFLLFQHIHRAVLKHFIHTILSTFFCCFSTFICCFILCTQFLAHFLLFQHIHLLSQLSWHFSAHFSAVSAHSSAASNHFMHTILSTFLLFQHIS